tara:strand:- start:148910 stop:149386 length:477 start_codon:yes stop_codon:yes gene_type:complete
MRKSSKKSKKKRIIDNRPASNEKTVHDRSEATNYKNRYVKFSTLHHDKDGEWGWESICGHTFLKDLFDKIYNDYSSMKYSELIDPKKNSHAVSFDAKGLHKNAIKRLSDLKLIDHFDELITIRVTGKKRLWCLHNEHVLHMLWWDPDHKIYPSHKKNT